MSLSINKRRVILADLEGGHPPELSYREAKAHGILGRHDHALELYQEAGWPILREVFREGWGTTTVDTMGRVAHPYYHYNSGWPILRVLLAKGGNHNYRHNGILPGAPLLAFLQGWGAMLLTA